MATTSPKFSLNLLDFGKGLVVAALTQPLLIILTSLAAGHFNINWTEQWHLAVASGAAYLLKNLFSGVSSSAQVSSIGKGAIIILLVMIGVSAHSQRLISPVSKTTYGKSSIQTGTKNKFARSVFVGDSTLPAPTKDSVYNGPRLGGVSLVYGVSAGYTASNIFAITGIDWTHATYTAATKRWYINWTAGLVIGDGGHSGPTNIQNVTVIGARATFLNGFLVVSALYSLNRPIGATSNWIAAAGGNTFFIPTN